MVGNVSAGDYKINTLDVLFPINLVMRLFSDSGDHVRRSGGISGSGKVTGVGSAVTAVKPGDRVNLINLMKASVFADVLKLKSYQSLKVDDTVSYKDSAPIAFGGMSAHHYQWRYHQRRFKAWIYGASGSGWVMRPVWRTLMVPTSPRLQATSTTHCLGGHD